MLEASSETPYWSAASLAKWSTNLLALQSMAVTNLPSDRSTVPMALGDLCAASQIKDLLIILLMSMLSQSGKMRFHNLAKGLWAAQAAVLPSSRKFSRLRQSVRILKKKQHKRTEINKAQPSATEASRIQSGGCPFPYAMREPSRATIIIAKPVRPAPGS